MVATVGWLFCSFKRGAALCKGGYKCLFGANNGLKKVPFGASCSIFKGLFGAVWGWRCSFVRGDGKLLQRGARL